MCVCVFVLASCSASKRVKFTPLEGNFPSSQDAPLKACPTEMEVKVVHVYKYKHVMCVLYKYKISGGSNQILGIPSTHLTSSGGPEASAHLDLVGL